MCGICGIVDYGGMDSRTRDPYVRNMTSAMHHRGPDGEGFYHNETVALGMRRLAVIDLHTGDQPIWNEDETICVFMNGEIYNHLELREKLKRLGHSFATRSDTETLIHLYEEHSFDLVQYLKGMFAFCIYDKNKNIILLARDKFGEKPLYYTFQDGIFSFASEVKALLENKQIDRYLNIHTLANYLAAAYPPEPHTLFKSVKVLPAGHFLILEEKGIKIKRYFSIDYSKKEKIVSAHEAVDYLKPILKQAILRQQLSDVPLGAFLSGGIDSSTICAILQENSDRPIQTFTVKFGESTYDESPIARKVAKYIGSDHHEVDVPNAEFSSDLFWEIIEHVGLPFPDSSAIPTYLISREIRQHVKVALSGDGGDEVFAGYPVFGWWQRIRRVQSYPKWLRKKAHRFLQSEVLPLSNLKRRRFIRGLDASFHDESQISFVIERMFFDDEIQRIMSQHPPLQFHEFSHVPSTYSTWTNLRKSMYYRITNKLVNDMLVKVDRMSMAHSLEVRSPFLDADLFEASLQIDDSLLYSKGSGKQIIKQIMKDRLPEEVFSHPKTGFSLPFTSFVNEKFHTLAKELFNSSNVLNAILSSEIISQIYQGLGTDSIQLSNYRSSHKLWALMLLFGWAERFKVQIE